MLSHLAGRLGAFVQRGGECRIGNESLPTTASASAGRTASLSAAFPMSDIAIEPNALASSSTDLPAEIWGEIARYSSRDDILNLRSTCAAIKPEADTAVSTMTLQGSDRLRAFTHSGSFRHLTLLRLVDVDDASLHHFTMALMRHPRNNLTLEIENSHQGVARGLAALSEVPLAQLRLQNVYLIESVLAALERCPFPIALSGYFCTEEFVGAVRIPTLRQLTSPSTEFDDAIAQAFAQHRGLRVLSLSACDNLTSRGMADLARIPTLQALSIDESLFWACPIDATAARALAANPTMERLSIPSGKRAPSEETVAELSKSRTLKRLEISVCNGTHRLADLVSLEDLTLYGGRNGPSISVPIAQAVARLPNLHTLCLNATEFAAGALNTLLAECRAKHLVLQNISLHQEEIAGPNINDHLKALTLLNVGASRALLLPLQHHPGLESFTVHGQSTLTP